MPYGSADRMDAASRRRRPSAVTLFIWLSNALLSRWKNSCPKNECGVSGDGGSGDEDDDDDPTFADVNTCRNLHRYNCQTNERNSDIPKSISVQAVIGHQQASDVHAVPTLRVKDENFDCLKKMGSQSFTKAPWSRMTKANPLSSQPTGMSEALFPVFAATFSICTSININ